MRVTFFHCTGMTQPDFLLSQPRHLQTAAALGLHNVVNMCRFGNTNIRVVQGSVAINHQIMLKIMLKEMVAPAGLLRNPQTQEVLSAPGRSGPPLGTREDPLPCATVCYRV